MPLLFLNGRWEIGQLDEQVHLFEGDLDGDGRKEKVLVRFLPKADKVRWKVRLRQTGRRLEGAWGFKGWKVLNAAATDKFGDGRWHIFLAMAKATPLTMRVIDCRFEPKKGWQMTEMSRWEIKKTMPWQKLQVPDWTDLTVGDTDGDGRDEVMVERQLLWRLGQRWIVKSLTSAQGQTIVRHLPWKEVGGRLWFFREVMHWSNTPHGFSSTTEPVMTLGTFDTHGRWRPMVQYRRSYFCPHEARAWLEDLNGDRCPELLTFEGLIWNRPVLHYRSLRGQWRKANLPGGSLARELNAFLKGSGAGVGPTSSPLSVRWDGKGWFVIVWNDGVVQAITLKGK